MMGRTIFDGDYDMHWAKGRTADIRGFANLCERDVESTAEI